VIETEVGDTLIVDIALGVVNRSFAVLLCFQQLPQSPEQIAHVIVQVSKP
jgi:hypothetical protein